MLLGIVYLGAVFTLYALSGNEGYRAHVESLATKVGGPQLCEFLLVTQITWTPSDDCRNEVAIQRRDITQCGGDWTCFSAYFKVVPSDIDTCRAVSNALIGEDIPASNTPVGGGRVKYSSGTTAYTARDMCWQQLNAQMHDVRICAVIEREAAKDGCYIAIAQMKNQPDLCRTHVLTSANRDICYQMVAARLELPHLCIHIADEKKKSDCERWSQDDR